MVQLCERVALYGDGSVRCVSTGQQLENVRLSWLTVVKDKYLVGISGQELLVYTLNNESSAAEEVFRQRLTTEVVYFEKFDIDGQWLALSTSNNVVIVYNLLSCKVHTRLECLAPVTKLEIDSQSSALIIAAEYLRILNLATF